MESANPFVFFDKEDKFKVEYTSEAAHNDAVALKITFKADHPNYGGWGIGQLPSLDVTGFSTVSFYLKGTSIGQTFEFKLKDMDRNEKSKDVTVESDQWTEIAFALNQENFSGVDLSRLENINLGFNDGVGNATIYVDDFAFK